MRSKFLEKWYGINGSPDDLYIPFSCFVIAALIFIISTCGSCGSPAQPAKTETAPPRVTDNRRRARATTRATGGRLILDSRSMSGSHE